MKHLPAPPINFGTPERKVIEMLADQVSAQIMSGEKFDNAMNQIMYHEYGQRFRHLYRRVAKKLRERSNVSRRATASRTKWPADRSQMLLGRDIRKALQTRSAISFRPHRDNIFRRKSFVGQAQMMLEL